MPLLLLVLFPLAEIATFIMVGGAIGLLRTLALVVISSALGAAMLRDAGIMTVVKLQRGGNPVAVAAEGGTRMLAGLLLLIPGFLTDLAAGLVLIPVIRRWLVQKAGGGTAAAQASQAHGQVVEGDFRRIGEKD